MRWMLDAVGVGTHGLRGELRVRGLVAVWLWTVRTWQRDDSADLSTTMAALDSALHRAESAASWLGGGASRGTGDVSAEPGLPDEPSAGAPEDPVPDSPPA